MILLMESKQIPKHLLGKSSRFIKLKLKIYYFIGFKWTLPYSCIALRYHFSIAQASLRSSYGPCIAIISKLWFIWIENQLEPFIYKSFALVDIYPSYCLFSFSVNGLDTIDSVKERASMHILKPKLFIHIFYNQQEIRYATVTSFFAGNIITLLLYIT